MTQLPIQSQTHSGDHTRNDSPSGSPTESQGASLGYV
jgi:hypothetical protein